jgi:TrmH RNA methyltransferase
MEMIYGVHAALAVGAARPGDLVRVAHTARVRCEVATLLRAAATRHVPCVELDDAALARFAGSLHHEGVAIACRPRRLATLEELAERLEARRGAAVALDGISNPHNLGGVVRSAAYFGVDAVVTSTEPGNAQLTPAAVRVAEGGAEHVMVARVHALGRALAALRARGVRVVGADARAPRDALTERWIRPCVLVVGNERRGLTPAVRAECDDLVAVRGHGAIDSLNVSVAAGVLLAALVR